MKRFFWALAVGGLIAASAPLNAQAVGPSPTPAPAIPADPSQAMPAQPVETPPASTSAPVAAPVNSIDAVPAIPAADTNVPPVASVPSPSSSLAIMADSSLRLVLQELAQSWADSQESSPQVPLTLTNAGTMVTKIAATNGDWDLIISADVGDVKDLTDRGLLFAEGQRTLARNTLVIDGRTALIKDDQLDWFDLIGTEWKKVALGIPDLVASGRVAKRALIKHDLFDDDHKSLYVYAGTETLALQAAERGEADAVFCYRTDLPTVNLPGFEPLPIKTEDAPPIFYTAAVCRLAKNPALAHAFIEYCSTDAAKEIWTKYGFETN